MTDSNTAPPAQGTLVDVKDVVAENIAKSIGLIATEAEVATIRQHVEDELSAIHTHFALAVQDVQHAYEAALIDAKSGFSFVREHPVALGLVSGALMILGAVLGRAL